MTNYLDKDGLKKFWEITKGKYSVLGHKHSGIISADYRNTVISPTFYDNGLYPIFMANKTDGLNDGGEFHGILHWRPYSWGLDMSGVKPYQIACTVNGRLWTRIATSSTAWDNWYKIARTNDIPTKLSQLTDDVVKGKYLPLSGGTLTGDVIVSKEEAIVRTGSSNGIVELFASTNRGLYDATTSKWLVATIKANNNTMMMNGNVGINTMTPDSRLHVNGTLHAVGASTLDSTLSVGGAATLNSSLTVKGTTTVQGLTVNGATSVQDLTVNGVLTTKGNGVELYHKTPFIDFHYGNSSDDYNVRIWNNVSGGLQINAHTLIDLVGPMKSSGGRLWITNGNTNIYDVKTTGLTSYVPVKHALTSQFVGNVGIGTDADAAYKLKVNGKAYFGANAIVNGDLQVNGIINNGDFYTDGDGWVYTTQLNISEGGDIVIRDSDGGEHILNLTKAIELGIFT